MKTLNLLIAGVLITGSAFAAKVGDTAIFTGTMSNAGGSYPATLTMKVTSLAASGKFTVESSISVMGQTQAQSAERTADEVGDEAKAAQLIANCSSMGGVPEPISISSGEILGTCKVTTMNNGVTTTTNIAAIPFLIARLVQVQNGITTNLTVQSYVRGQ